MSEDQPAADVASTEAEDELSHPPDTQEEASLIEDGSSQETADEAQTAIESEEVVEQPLSVDEQEPGAGDEEVVTDNQQPNEEVPANLPPADSEASDEASATPLPANTAEETFTHQEESGSPAQEEKVDQSDSDHEEEEASQDTRDQTSTTEYIQEEFTPVECRPVSGAAPLEDIIEEEEVVDREGLIESLQEALAEQEKLSALGDQLEHKIAEYFMTRKKTEEKVDPARNVTDQEKRYVQLMSALDRLKLEMREMEELFQQQEQQLQMLKEEKMTDVTSANAEFVEYRREKALTAVHSRSGKKLTSQELDQYQSWENVKEKEVIAMRLENIKLQNKIAKLETLIKEKEQLAEGLHMIDFEQLKINNIDLNEKIEERNEDILKLRRKVTSTVQVLSHVKEKLQFLQTENVEKRNRLKEMDSVVAKSRDHLTRMKQARDSLRMDNNRLKQRGGLVGHKALLRDYEERKDQNEELASRLDTLQQHHSELSVMCEGLRRKIEQAKTITTHHM